MRALINDLRPRLGFVATIVVVAVLAAACAGSSDTSSGLAAGGDGRRSPSPDNASLDDDAQALVFAECMRDNGVDMPDPGPGEQGLMDAFHSVADTYDQETLRQAISACQKEMPQFAQEEQHTQDAMLELAECLREQGLEVSDQPFNDVHSGEIDQNEFVAAMEVCRDVLIGGNQ